jgi:hypothetical protein
MVKREYLMPKVKGSNVLLAVKMLRADRQRALALLPPRLHRYLDQRILVSTWYPEEDLLELSRAVSLMMPGSPEPWMTMGRSTARADLSTLYRHMVRAGDLTGTLGSIGSLWRTYHDTGELNVTVDEPGRATACLRDYGGAAREMCRVVGGYVAEVAVMAGAREVNIAKLGCSLNGAAECRWRLTWS